MRAASIPIFEEEAASETGILVRDAIAAVREVARLDDRVVLPPLPAVEPRKTVVVLGRRDLPRIANDVVASPPAVTAATHVAAWRAALVDTRRTRRRAASRFPVALCALVAVASGIASYLASPHAQRSEAVRELTASIGSAASSAATWLRDAVD